MITFVPGFVSCTGASSIEKVIDHIDHAVKIASIDNVGLGADFDGIEEVSIHIPIFTFTFTFTFNKTIPGLSNVSTYPALIEAMIKRKYTDQQIIAIMGGNVLRALQKAGELGMLRDMAETDRDKIETQTEKQRERLRC